MPILGWLPSVELRFRLIAGQISPGNILSGWAVMFGEEFGDCWHEIPGVSGLELSGDLRFRGPRVLRKLRHDCNGRPYAQARKALGPASGGQHREGGVMLHRNNWPDNLYLRDRQSNAADRLSRGERVGGRCQISWRAQEHGQSDQALYAAQAMLTALSIKK